MPVAKIYLATSWRNPYHDEVLKALCEEGHKVYDFKNPAPYDKGFSWAEIDPHWEQWTFAEYMEAMRSRRANMGYLMDFTAMEWADTFVLLWPCGRSAHLELGWACGRGKRTAVLAYGENEPELMIKMADFITDDYDKLLWWLDPQTAAEIKRKITYV